MAKLVRWTMPTSEAFKYDLLKSTLIRCQHDLGSGILFMFVDFSPSIQSLYLIKLLLIYPQALCFYNENIGINLAFKTNVFLHISFNKSYS